MELETRKAATGILGPGLELWVQIIIAFVVLYHSFFFLFCCFKATPTALEVPRLGMNQLQLLAYARATETWDPSHVCNLHHNSQQFQILNSLNKARDWACVLMDTSQVHNSLVHSGNSQNNQISKNDFPASSFSHRQLMTQPFHIILCLIHLSSLTVSSWRAWTMASHLCKHEYSSMPDANGGLIKISPTLYGFVWSSQLDSKSKSEMRLLYLFMDNCQLQCLER